MILNEDSIAAYRELIINPSKNGMEFASLSEIFSENSISLPKDLVYSKYIEIIKKPLPKIFFYIIMDEIYKSSKSENGDLGYLIKFNF
jgi:hypothetical protein